MRTFLGLALLGTLAFGCGSAGGGTSSGLYGRVLVPTPGPCRIHASCEQPAPHYKLSFYRAGQSAGQTTTDAKGRYRLSLPPATYTVRAGRSKVGKAPAPSRATVPSGSFKRVDFHVDNGIR